MKFYKENKINPYASCLPIVFQIPIFISLFFVLRDFEKEIFPQFPASSLEWLGLVDITEPTKDGWGPVLIAVYVASQLTSTYLMSTSMQSKAQRYMIMFLPIVFLPFILGFPVRADDLLAHHEPVDDGTGARHASTHAQARRSAEALEPNTAEGGRGVGERRGLERRPAPPGCAVEPALRDASSESAEGGRADEPTPASSPSRRPARRSARRSGPRCASSSRASRVSIASRCSSRSSRRASAGFSASASRRRTSSQPRSQRDAVASARRARPTTWPASRVRSSSGSPPGSEPTSRSPRASATASSR